MKIRSFEFPKIAPELIPGLSEIVVKAAEEFKPNLIANYLYELASTFNSFYASVPVLKEKDANARKARLVLIRAVTIVLKNGLMLLGIRAPEEM